MVHGPRGHALALGWVVIPGGKKTLVPHMNTLARSLLVHCQCLASRLPEQGVLPEGYETLTVGMPFSS